MPLSHWLFGTTKDGATFDWQKGMSDGFLFMMYEWMENSEWKILDNKLLSGNKLTIHLVFCNYLLLIQLVCLNILCCLQSPFGTIVPGHVVQTFLVFIQAPVSVNTMCFIKNVNSLSETTRLVFSTHPDYQHLRTFSVNIVHNISKSTKSYLRSLNHSFCIDRNLY